MILPKSIQNTDPFSKAPPGYSLTKPPGSYPWESPPEYADADEAVDFLVDQIETPQAQDRYLKLLVSGISIEEIVTSIAIAGFQEGFFNPDVAELVKLPLSVYFMNMAEENDIPVNVFATPDGGPLGEEDRMMDEDTILGIMRRRNPQVYREYISSIKATAPGLEPAEGVSPEMVMEQSMEEPEPELPGGFLAVNVEDVEQ